MTHLTASQPLIPLLAEGEQLTKPPTRLLLVKDGACGWQNDEADCHLTAKSAKKMIAEFEKHGSELVIDYHHATCDTEDKTRDKAPAAGWIKRLEYVKGEGLFAAEIEWTDVATEEILAKQYKYTSPTVYHDKKGNLLELHSLALTNRPRTIDAPELLAAERRYEKELTVTKHEEFAKSVVKNVLRLKGEDLEEFPAISDDTKAIADLITALNAAGATIESDATLAIVLTTAIELISGIDADEVEKEAQPTEEEVAAEKAAAEKTKEKDAIVSSAHKALASEVKTLRAELDERNAVDKTARVDTLIEGVIAANKLNPNDAKAMKAARSYAEKDEEGFVSLFESIEPYAPTSASSGETIKSGGDSRGRLISKASAEYTGGGSSMAVMCSKDAFVTQRLREAGEPVLTEDEVKTLK